YLSRPTLLVQAPHGARVRVPGRVSFPLGADATTSGARCLRCRPTTSDGRRVSKHRAAFRGFDRDAMQFWHELASEMSREWYLANKQRYEDLWLGPMLNLVGAVARGLAPVYKPLKLGAPGALRIHRDLRFSRDKTPYKTHIAAVIRLAGKPI